MRRIGIERWCVIRSVSEGLMPLRYRGAQRSTQRRAPGVVSKDSQVGLADSFLQPVRARSMLACGRSRNTTSDVPLEKQYSFPSSGLVQFNEQSALIRAPAATPIGSKLSNSPRMDLGGTAAFQIPSACLPSVVGGCAWQMNVANAVAASSGKTIREFELRRIFIGPPGSALQSNIAAGADTKDNRQ